MIKVIGKENCIHCQGLKTYLENENIIFTYSKIEELPKEEQKSLKQLAMKNKIMAFPLVFVNELIMNEQSFRNSLILKITKRNGQIATFDKSKIVNAINNAMFETGEIDNNLSDKIANEIQTEMKPLLNVEELQDLTISKLEKYNRKDIAKRYSHYRNKKTKEREIKQSVIKTKLLSEEFLSKYKHIKPPFTPLGEFVYYRTYSRWISELGRREYWWETSQRVVEYNCSLLPTTVEEAEALYDNIFNLRQFPSGRSLWIAGTKSAEEYPLSNFNCSFIVIDSFKKYSQCFHALMVGAGVGVRVLLDDVSKLPICRSSVEVIHKPYKSIRKKYRDENSSLHIKQNNAIIEIGDSKSGWTKALDFYFDILTDKDYKTINTITIDYDNVRPKGEKLLTFGGFASGHESILNMFVKINNIIKNKTTDKLKPIECMDIADIIAENVVVGGTRRSALIAIIDENDQEMIEAKSNLYTQDSNGNWIENKDILHRRMANNTIWYKQKPTRERLHWNIEKIRFSGEPAIGNEESALKRNPHAKGLNPCFTGDMRLLTSEGYKTFKELNQKEFKIINWHWHETQGKVWTNGIKKIIELHLSNGTVIKCTPNHLFMTDDMEEIQAKNLLGLDIFTRDKTKTVSVREIIDNNAEEIVYDFSEPETHWGIVEGCMVHNCAEIILDDQQTCNLSVVNLMSFVNTDGTYNKGNLFKAQRLSTRLCYRMTNVNLELNEWDIIQKRDRLLGCDITGDQDFINATHMAKDEWCQLLRELKAITRQSMKEIAEENNINESLLVTAGKPNGSLALLPTVSAGIHYSHSPYYIRRVRISSSDPLCKVVEDLGYPIFPEVGQDIETCDIKVIEFPVKAPEGRTKYDVSAIEQLENYKDMVINYVEMNQSITISVKNHEWEEVEQWLWDNWDDVVAVSFLSLDDNFYTLMPYESCTKEEYEKRVTEMKPFNPTLLQKYEKQESEEDLETDANCTSGACGLR